jgi:predicted acylesterase/phospholipase RssA
MPVHGTFTALLPSFLRPGSSPCKKLPPDRAEVLVLSGGGMKGVASLGATAALHKAGALKNVHTVVGTSAGALVAAALATGRAGPALLMGLACQRRSGGYRGDIDLGSFLTTFGIDDGGHLDHWIHTLLGGRTYTFRQLQQVHGKRLVVCATNLTRRGPQYFCPEDHPDMDVALALRMSCTIPLYFAAVRHEGGIYVDGAVADNFPIAWASDRYGAAKVVGVAFRPRASCPDASLEAYVGALLECTTRKHYVEDDPRVLMLDTGAKSAFDFGMSHRDMKKLYTTGARQARAWLKKNA